MSDARGQVTGSADASPPLTGAPFSVAIWAESELVASGVRHMLAPYAEWLGVIPAEHATSDADLVLADPFGLPGVPTNVLDDLSAARKLVIYTWADRRSPGDVHARRVGMLPTRGWLSKAMGGRDLASALLRIHGSASVPRDAAPAHRLLSGRETEVVVLIASGLTNYEIAESLHLSVNSVKTYIRSSYRKMGVTRRTQAVLWASEQGLRPAAASLDGPPLSCISARPPA